LSKAPPLVKRYHDALKLWQAFESQAEHAVQATHHLLFFGIRKTEIAPRFSIKDLEDADIALPEISEFITNTDRKETRKEIFHSVLSEFLQYQDVDRAFSYLLRQSTMFARKLKEGLAIYLSEHSPEKLAQEARAKYLELVDKLEKIISGMEAKSLTIPAAVLLAVSQPSIPATSTTVAATHPAASAPATTAPARPATFPVQAVDPNDPPLVDGQMVKAHIVVGNESGDLIPNQFGEFPRVHIDPKQTVSVTAVWPDAQPGQRVVAAVEDGGLLAGGKPVLAFTLDASRQASFDFTAGSGGGIYRVTLRQGPDTKIVQFWAGPDLALKQM